MSHTYRPMLPYRQRRRDQGALVCPHCGYVVSCIVRGAPLPGPDGGSFTGCLACARAHHAEPVRVDVGAGVPGNARRERDA